MMAGGGQPSSKPTTLGIHNLLDAERGNRVANSGLVKGQKQDVSKQEADEQRQKELERYRPLYEHATNRIDNMLSDHTTVLNKQVSSLQDPAKQLIAEIEKLLKNSGESIRELKKTSEDIKNGIKAKLEDAVTLKLIKLKGINCSLKDLKQKIWVIKNFVDFTLYSRNELNEFFEAERSQKRNFISVPTQNVARVANMLQTYSRVLKEAINDLLLMVRSKDESQLVLLEFGEIVDSLLSLICDVEIMNRQIKQAIFTIKQTFGISNQRYLYGGPGNKMELEDLNSANHSLNELGKMMF